MSRAPSDRLVRVGDQLPVIQHATSRVGVFLFGAAHWTAHRIHYDVEFAHDSGFDDVVVTGALMSGWTVQWLTTWAGDPHAVWELTERNVAAAVAGDTLTFAGRVDAVEPSTGTGAGVDVVCTFTITRQDDRTVVTGSARLYRPE
jgi:hydroxyacyl-ACP dehydratase HTD2-like protein with hotdog domain